MPGLIERLSLGWQTDLIFARFDGQVIERPDCLVLRMPSNPLFYWGNALILPEPPRDAELAHWLQRFEEEVGQHTRESGHVAIGFDAAAPHEPLMNWAAAGFEIFGSATLALTAAAWRRPQRALAPEFHIRPLDLNQESELAAVLDLQCESNDAGFEPFGYRVHRERQMRRYAAMQAAGLGAWFALFAGEQMLADCGLFRATQIGRPELGRFQHVGTHPAWRRRGLCTALIDAVVGQGLQVWGLERLLMCADPDDVAIGIYESLGFSRALAGQRRAFGAQRRPARDRTSAEV